MSGSRNALAAVRRAAAHMGVQDTDAFVGACTRVNGRLAHIDYAFGALLVRAQVHPGHRVVLVEAATAAPLTGSVLRRIARGFGVGPRDKFAVEMFTHIAQIADADLAPVAVLSGARGAIGPVPHTSVA